MSVHKNKAGVWYVSYRDSDGRQRTKSFGKGIQGKKDAQQRDLEIKLDRKRGREVKGPSKAIDIYDVAQAYINDLRLRGKSKGFIDQLVSLINHHLGPVLAFKPVEKLTYGEVTARVTSYDEKRGTGRATIQHHLRYLRTMFRFAMRHEMIAKNPLEHWRGEKYQPKAVKVTREDLEAIKEHALPHLRWAIEVMEHLGVRPGKTELFALKWGRWITSAGRCVSTAKRRIHTPPPLSVIPSFSSSGR